MRGVTHQESVMFKIYAPKKILSFTKNIMALLTIWSLTFSVHAVNYTALAGSVIIRKNYSQYKISDKASDDALPTKQSENRIHLKNNLRCYF